jgi:hypothetical protein
VWKLKTALEDACMQHEDPAAYAQVDHHVQIWHWVG